MAEVGKKTGKTTQANRDVYETPEGEMVSEKSTTFKYKGKWINVPTIHKGYSYDEDTLKMMLDAELISPTSTHKNKESAIKAAEARSKSLKFAEGGLLSQMTSIFSGDKDSDNTEEEDQDLDIGNVPFFKRPMDAGPNDRVVGQSEEGTIYETVLGNQYTVKLDPDQRTELTKIKEDVLPAVKEYLKDPKAPTSEQAIAAAKAIAGDAWETISIPGDLLTGEKGASDVTMGDVFGMVGGQAVGSAPFKAPEGALRVFGGPMANNPPNMRDYGGIESSFEDETNFQTQTDLDIDFENDPSGSMVRMMDEIERNPTLYPRTLEQIKMAKWFRGRDNMMRFEIDDSESKATPQFATVHTRDELDDIFSGHSYEDDGFMSPYDPSYTDSQEKMYSTLGDVFSHRDLFRQYPELSDMPVVVDKTMDKDTLGYYDPNKGLIAISSDIAKDADATRSTLLHEIQHAVQRIEGFETGTGSVNMDVIDIKMAAKNSPTIKNIEAEYEKELDNYLNSSIEIKKDFISEGGKKLAESIKEFELRLIAEKSSTVFKDSNAISFKDLKKKYDSSESIKQLVEDLSAKDLPSEDKIFTSHSTDLTAAEALAKGKAPYGFILPPNENFSDMPVPISGGISYLDSIDKSTNIKRSNEYADNYVKQLETVLARVADRAVEEGKTDLFKKVFKLNPDDVVDNFVNGSPDVFIEKTSGLQVPYRPDEPVITPLKLNGYDTNRLIYHSKRGEVEARNVQKRMDMSYSERTPENVYSTEDVVPEEQWGDPELKGVKAGEDIFAKGKVFGLKGKPETKPEPKPDPKEGFIGSLKKKFGFGENSSEITNTGFLPKDFGYRVDNPSEEWAKRKQEAAEKYAKEGGLASQKLLSGPQTAFLGTNESKPLYLNTDFLFELKGANDEIADASNSKYIQLKESVAREGFDPNQKNSTILVGVNHKGEAFIMEGNNRVAVAKEFDVPNLKVEVKYFNGAEDVNSPYSPQNILKHASQKPRQFAEGGAVGDMRKQMSLFEQGGITDDGMDVDPVSGNEVPSGSLAKEVRDDIPAQLSEGEYVVPADVVRYYGVKFFEDLRSEAKMGLTEMEEDGRIGGEPIMDEPMGSSSLDENDMMALEQMLSTGAANGGLMDKMATLAKTDKMVNDRMNANGLSVGYAQGGSVQQTPYDNPTEIDQVINRVLTVAQQNPQILDELARRGIQVSRTTPQMQPKQMDQANPPAEARQGMSEGGLPNTVPNAFNPDMYSSLGGSYTYAGGTVPQVGETAASCEAKGMSFDPITRTCVPKPAEAPVVQVPQAGGSSDDQPPAPPTTGESPSFTGGLEGLDFTNTKSMTDWAEGLSEPVEGRRYMQGAGILAAGLPGLAVAGAGLATKDLTDISDLRAAAIVAKARGDDALAKSINESLDDRLKSSSGVVEFLDDIVASGKGKAESYAKELGYEDLKAAEADKFSRIQSIKEERDGGTATPTTPPPGTGKPDGGSGSDSSDDSNIGNYRGDRDGDGVPNWRDFNDGVGWADSGKKLDDSKKDDETPTNKARGGLMKRK